MLRASQRGGVQGLNPSLIWVVSAYHFTENMDTEGGASLGFLPLLRFVLREENGIIRLVRDWQQAGLRETPLG